MIIIMTQVNEQLDKMDGVVEAFSVDVLKAKKLVNIGEDVSTSPSLSPFIIHNKHHQNIFRFSIVDKNLCRLNLPLVSFISPSPTASSSSLLLSLQVMIQHAFARDSLEPKCTELKIMCKRQVAVLMIMMVVKIVMMKRMVVIPAVVATKNSSL